MRNLEKAAPPLEMVLKGGDPNKVVIWGCGTCKISASSFEQAQSCCAPWVCEECGKEVTSYCKECSDKKQWAKDKALYDKAKKVTYAEYAGVMLYCDHCENYYDDVDGFLDGHDDTDDPPTWAWGTYEKKFRIDADDMLEGQLEREEMHEDAMSHYSKEAITALQLMLDSWTENNPVNTYYPDNDVVVDLDKEVEAALAERRSEAPISP